MSTVNTPAAAAGPGRAVPQPAVGGGSSFTAPWREVRRLDLARRRCGGYAGGGPAAVEERLLGLGWAVRAGRFVLAGRPARALRSASGVTQPSRGQL